MSASHADRFSRLRWPGVVRERPTKTAIVNRELTFTRPSSAVTWMLVVAMDEAWKIWFNEAWKVLLAGG